MPLLLGLMLVLLLPPVRVGRGKIGGGVLVPVRVGDGLDKGRVVERVRPDRPGWVGLGVDIKMVFRAERGGWRVEREDGV